MNHTGAWHVEQNLAEVKKYLTLSQLVVIHRSPTAVSIMLDLPTPHLDKLPRVEVRSDVRVDPVLRGVTQPTTSLTTVPYEEFRVLEVPDHRSPKPDIQVAFVGNLETILISESPNPSQPKLRVDRYYINGVWTSLRESSTQDLAVARIFGDTTHVINNPETPGFMGYLKATGGLLSSRVGSFAERDAIKLLCSEIREDLNADTRVVITAHSQGAIIAHNALDVLRREDQKWFTDRSSRISVRFFGIGLEYWPPGVDVHGYSFRSDHVTTITKPVNGIVANTKQFVMRRPYEHHPITYISGKDHDFNSYLKDWPDFFIAEHGVRDGRIDGRRLGVAFVRSLLRSECSDSVYSHVLDQGLTLGGKPFAQAVLQYSEPHELGIRVGNWIIPTRTAQFIRQCSNR